jgi:hypothetical protein
MYQNDEKTDFALTPNHQFEVTRPRGTITYITNDQARRVGTSQPTSSAAEKLYIIGDSYTYGWGVNAEDTFVSGVQDPLDQSDREVQVYNLGVPGYGTKHALSRLEQFVTINGLPQHVLYVFSPNDPSDNVDKDKTVVMGVRMNEGASFKPVLASIAQVYHRSRLVAFAIDTVRHAYWRFSLRGKQHFTADLPASSPHIIALETHLQSLVAWAKAHNAKLYVASTDGPSFDYHLRRILDAAYIPFLPLESVFATANLDAMQRRNPLPDGHWTVEVNALVAQALTRQFFLPLDHSSD